MCCHPLIFSFVKTFGDSQGKYKTARQLRVHGFVTVSELAISASQSARLLRDLKETFIVKISANSGDIFRPLVKGLTSKIAIFSAITSTKDRESIER